MDNSKKEKLIKIAKVIFYGLPIGKNAPHDTPIIGNQSLAQVVVNRCNSATKSREEFKYLVSCITQMIKETKGQVISKIKLDQTNKEIVSSGLTDSKGFLIKKEK